LPYVYADILFLVNFCFNFSLLYLAGRLSRSPVVGRRLVLAAALGAAYGLASVFPEAGFLMSLPTKLLVSGVMVAVAYPTPRLASFGAVLGLFYLGAFVVGGAAMAWTYLTSDTPGFPGGVAGGLGLGVVLPSAMLAAALLHWAVVAGRERAHVLAYCVPCRVVIGGQEAEFPALIDTGNRLRDPISDALVVIVEYPAIDRLLPPEIAPVWQTAEPDHPDLGSIAGALGPWSSRLRLIPFSSIGRASGLLVGFKPDAVIVGGRGRTVRRTDVIVCVSPRPLSAGGGYRALLPPEALEADAAARAS
jgi:stage II sporulation protein GA (sporulation sigma-E factor processing peptidase)